jgi:hypothetical protein
VIAPPRSAPALRGRSGAGPASRDQSCTTCHQGLALASLDVAAYGEVRQTIVLSGYALWRAAVGIANSEDLTHAASIGYYSLLSLFPFLLLAISVLGAITADEGAREPRSRSCCSTSRPGSSS